MVSFQEYLSLYNGDGNNSIKILHEDLSNIDDRFIQDTSETKKITDFESLALHIRRKHDEVLKFYTQYVQDRLNGRPRVMFTTHLHACWYLAQIAPTKMVDGVWLSTVHELENVDPTIINILHDTYLDECGNGSLEQNHVEMYRRLLNTLFSGMTFDIVEDWVDNFMIDKANSSLFDQGAIQMALSYCSDDMFPELVGYNLGYEQIALHMLITCYELREFNIDDSYFNVHLTIDNLDCGHAQKALKAVQIMINKDPTCFQRILNGFKLSNSTTCAIYLSNLYNVKNVVNNILNRKSNVSHSLHDTIPINDTETLGDLMRSHGDLLDYLINNGYFDGQEFENTEFNKLLKTRMLGSFLDIEIEYIKEWFNEQTNVSHHGRGHESSLSKDESRICTILEKNIHKHHAIMLKHPVTGCIDSMLNWWTKSKPDFILCISSKDAKQLTSNSFRNGKMKRLQISDDDREFITSWCKI